MRTLEQAEKIITSLTERLEKCTVSLDEAIDLMSGHRGALNNYHIHRDDKSGRKDLPAVKRWEAKMSNFIDGIQRPTQDVFEAFDETSEPSVKDEVPNGEPAPSCAPPLPPGLPRRKIKPRVSAVEPEVRLDWMKKIHDWCDAGYRFSEVAKHFEVSESFVREAYKFEGAFEPFKEYFLANRGNL